MPAAQAGNDLNRSERQIATVMPRRASQGTFYSSVCPSPPSPSSAGDTSRPKKPFRIKHGLQQSPGGPSPYKKGPPAVAGTDVRSPRGAVGPKRALLGPENPGDTEARAHKMQQQVNGAKYNDHSAGHAPHAKNAPRQIAKLSAIQSALHFQMGYAPQQPPASYEAAEQNGRMLILGVGASPGHSPEKTQICHHPAPHDQPSASQPVMHRPRQERPQLPAQSESLLLP